MIGAILLLIVVILTLISVSFMAGRMSVKPAPKEPLFAAPIIPVSSEVAAYQERVQVMAERIAFLERVQVVPATPFVQLPAPAVVPTRFEIHMSERLAVEVIRLREQLETVTGMFVSAERRRAQHWRSLKRLRAQVRTWVPVEVADRETELRGRALVVARKTSTRAAVVTEAVGTVQTMVREHEDFEALLPELFAEVDRILFDALHADQHMIPVAS